MQEVLIRKIPLFASLPDEEVHRLAASLSRREFGPGELLMREAQQASRFFILLEGEVEIIKALGTKDERLLAVRRPGTFIGEMGLLSEEKLHTASVRARTPIRLLEMSHAQFDALLHRHPRIGYDMVRILSRRLNEAENLTIEDLRRKNAELTRAYEELAAAQAQLIEKERLERELEVAREIQSSILPEALPSLSGYDFGARMEPMSAVGGDFYDFIPLDKNRLGVVLGDVSDHGVPAALFMAMTAVLMRAAARRAKAPGAVLAEVNRQLLGRNRSGMFVTVVYGVLDLESRIFQFVRGGHELPVLLDGRGAWVELPREHGQVLGILEEPEFREQRVTLEPGGLLLLHTDGVNEAVNPSGALYGYERLQRALAEAHALPAQAICDMVVTQVAHYRGDASQQDDIAIVVVKAS